MSLNKENGANGTIYNQQLSVLRFTSILFVFCVRISQLQSNAEAVATAAAGNVAPE